MWLRAHAAGKGHHHLYTGLLCFYKGKADAKARRFRSRARCWQPYPPRTRPRCALPSGTRNSKPRTRELETRNPKPESEKPEPEARNPRPETRNRGWPLTLSVPKRGVRPVANPKPYTPNSEPRTLNLCRDKEPGLTKLARPIQTETERPGSSHGSVWRRSCKDACRCSVEELSLALRESV